MADPDPLIGKKLGDYTIVDLLGKGGMARVYRGYDSRLDRYAAVKVIDGHLLPDQDEEEYRRRFQNEAKAIARLAHPCIVGIYQFGQVSTTYFMAMQFIDGRDLRQILRNHARSGSRMSYSEILDVMRDIGSALDYAHKEGVIHRDVKPSNIMVKASGQCVLTDFGLALRTSEGTSGLTFGSAHYIAPEQAMSSANAVPQSDLYSLGVVLYEMLTGQVPFNDPSSPMSIVLRHISEPPPRLSLVNPNIGEAVEAVVMKAMSKAPADRYASCADMVRDLQQAIAQESSVMRLPVAPLPSWDSTSSVSEVSKSTFKSSPVPTKTPVVVDDVPTITDSRPSSRQRAAILLAARYRRYAPAAAVVGVLFIVIAALLVLAGGQTPDSTATPTAESLAAAVMTAETTPTEEPSPAPTTAVPTVPPTRQPTRTVVSPTNAPTAEPTATPTPTLVLVSAAEITAEPSSDEPQIVLRYDRNSLVLLNQSDRSVDVSGLTFVQERPDGDPLTFETRLWEGGSAPTRALPTNSCFEVWTMDTGWQSPPDYCGRRHAYFQAGLTRVFWISDDPDATFEVRRGSAALATCSISAGECKLDVRR